MYNWIEVARWHYYSHYAFLVASSSHDQVRIFDKIIDQKGSIFCRGGSIEYQSRDPPKDMYRGMDFLKIFLIFPTKPLALRCQNLNDQKTH